jgi:ATP-binding cassette, subfamily D (ALD), member 3
MLKIRKETNFNQKKRDQVITQDVQKFSEGMCGLFANFVKPVADILLYTTKLVELTGWIGPVVIVGYMFFSWIFITIIRPNFAKLTSQYQELQGTFRYTHVRTATNGESIAFYGGDSLEKNVAESNFDLIYQQKTKMNTIKRNFESLKKTLIF